jgi:multimeric flavodoxin WrbA
MTATILLATLKKTGLSNTETLCEFFAGKLNQHGITSEIIKLADREIPPGTYSNMGPGDAWPAVLERILASQLLIFATPIWWGGHSSLMQRVIERLDELHDHVLEGESSLLEGKVGGIIITGDSDGAQHVIGNICNFCNALGVLVPPYATLSVLWDGQAKGKTPTREALLAKYESDYAATAEKMIAQMLSHAPRR